MGINTTDIELYGESYSGYIWVRVSHLSLFSLGGMQNIPFIDLIYMLFMLGLIAVIGRELITGKIKRRPMDNVEWELKEKKLLIKFDIKKEYGKSMSGKTIIVANSHGGKRLMGTGLTLGMVAYKYPEQKETKPRKKHEMQNIDIKLDKNNVTVTIDTEKDFGMSSKGKSIIVASTRGNQPLEGTDILMGINVFKKIQKHSGDEKKSPTKMPSLEKEDKSAMPTAPKEHKPAASKALKAEELEPAPKEHKPAASKAPKEEELEPAPKKEHKPAASKAPKEEHLVIKLTLDDVPGLGPAKIKALNAVGILTIDDLIKCDPQKVASEVKGLGITSLKKWIQSAKDLAHAKKNNH
jgi:predicted flap endonuclease-1-like 5' DNA nuclease